MLLRGLPLFRFICCMWLLSSGALAQDASLIDGRFTEGKGAFWQTGNVRITESTSGLCATVRKGGAAPWDAQIGVGSLKLIEGRDYLLSARITGTADAALLLRVQSETEPYDADLSKRLSLPLPGDVFSARFTAGKNELSSLIFQLGGAAEDFDLCLYDVSLREMPTKTQTSDASLARVNQAGYIFNGPKRATIVTPAADPLPFRLLNGQGKAVFNGRTIPRGFDPMAGLNTHVADFSSYRQSGERFTLVLSDSTSPPFSIGKNIYDRLSIDAQSWFYLARSGIEIREDIAGEAYARPAGHVGIAPNQGDANVPCLDRSAAAEIYPFEWSCNYRLDVRGGWYDAGDQGKYVVNGAIAAAQLMDTMERGRLYARDPANLLGDQRLRIPETGNGVPDILDEARWELEFLMKMVVPDGNKFAGMVHHKIHDTRWTGPPMLPHLDPEPRALYAPSTAATLNLVAAAAQGSRLFRSYDKSFSAHMLTVAEKAWGAARKHPDILAPETYFEGGGSYGDKDVSDEFYWAASELYLTTGNAKYLRFLKQSPHWNGDVFIRAGHGAFDWASTAGLARLHLALYGKTTLPQKDWQQIRGSVIAGAQILIATQKKEPFGLIYHPQDGQYDWGSNHLILQNMIVVAAAYDLTRTPEYLQSVRESMDYILGRNPMNISYVTGYGAVFSHNQHSRWFARQLDESLPNPPSGSLAGGPNSRLNDEISRAKLNGCAPQQCYIDDIEAFSTNEITINWNAPLAYVANFLADTAGE
jgi:endoglucanase